MDIRFLDSGKPYAGELLFKSYSSLYRIHAGRDSDNPVIVYVDINNPKEYYVDPDIH
jgi:hypothetical protein